MHLADADASYRSLNLSVYLKAALQAVVYVAR